MSRFMKKGVFSSGASVNALDVSAPIIICHLVAVMAQNIFDAVWSRIAVYVSPRVTVSCIRSDPLHRARAFLVPLSFMTYVHMNGRRFESGDIAIGLEIIPCSSYCCSCFLSVGFQCYQSSCLRKILRVSLVFLLVHFMVLARSKTAQRYV